jgi:putative phosphoesterase
MKIIVTSDLHYGMREDGDESARALAKTICDEGGDVLLLCGDNARLPLKNTIDCLSLFKHFAGRKLVVAGNHDLWVNGDAPFDSRDMYSVILPEIYHQCGFHGLDYAPTVINDIGFVGTVGWYDYSFREPALDLPLETYEKKILDDGTIWMDIRYIRWKYTDPEFTNLTLAKLREQISIVETKCETIIAALHHLPFENLVMRRADRAWSFANAFMGSAKYGEELLKHPTVKYAICGHTHVQRAAQNGHMNCFSIGSNYRTKRREILDI